MCKKTFDVVGLNSKRDAYEVESVLDGLQNVQDAQADFINNTIMVEYDETRIDQETVLDEIEHAGCTPDTRINGMLDRIRTKVLR